LAPGDALAYGIDKDENTNNPESHDTMKDNDNVTYKKEEIEFLTK